MAAINEANASAKPPGLQNITAINAITVYK